MAHRPLWTGLGIIGGWLAAILGLTFYARKLDRPEAVAADAPLDAGRSTSSP